MHTGLVFNWDIHYKCNYRCPYCWFHDTWHLRRDPKVQPSAADWVAAWGRIFDRYGPAYIEIVGGEPFLYPDLLFLVKEISKLHRLNITTNLSTDIKRFADEIDPGRVKVGPTLHPAFVEIQHFLEKAGYLKKKGFLKSVSCLAYPPQIQSIPFYKKKLNDMGIDLTVQTFWGKYKEVDYPLGYTDEEKRVFQGDLSHRVGERFQLLPKADVRGKLCDAGMRYGSVRPDGMVFRCGNAGNDELIGNLLNEDFSLLDCRMPCKSEFCKCNEWAFLLEGQTVSLEEFSENKAINIEETRKRKIVLDSKPLKLGVILTDWCNLDCIMCVEARHKGQFTLPLSFLRKIDTLLPYLEYISWQGGEFFHLPYMKDYFNSLKRHAHISHEITTNGLLLDEEWIGILSNLNIKLSFSIDSPRSDVYEYIRRGGSYQRLINNLNMLKTYERKHGKSLRRIIVVVVMKSNLSHLLEFLPFIKEFGFESINFSPVYFIESEENIFMNPGNLDFKFMNETRDTLERECTKLGVAFGWKLPKYKEAFNQAENVICDNKPDELFCNLPWKSMWIRADSEGDIFPDCSCEYPIGNISKDSLLEAWNGVRMQEYRRKIAEKDVSLCKKECVSNYTIKMNDKIY